MSNGPTLTSPTPPYGSSTDLAAGALLVLGDETVGGTARVLVSVRRRLDHDFVSSATSDVGGWAVVAETATQLR